MRTAIERSARRLLLPILGTLAVLQGCASLPEPIPHTPTHAWQQPQATTLGRWAARAAPNRQYSGVRLLASGDEALGALMALADQAERTLDLQYYLVHNDAAARAVLRRVHAAARRGVRVRFLLDDLNTAEKEASLMCLTDHPNIEVRLYNPFPSGRFSTATRVLASLTDLRRINHRMHNKMFVTDNAMAVTGGRNLGDAYFLNSPSTNFVDLDVLVAGPAVAELSSTFDSFWNSELAYPLHRLVGGAPDCAGAVAAAPRAPQAGALTSGEPEATLVESKDIDATPRMDAGVVHGLLSGRLRLQWVPATVIADKPSKIASEGNPDRSETIEDDILGLLRTAQREVLIVSPYFVPGRRGVALARELRERGVRMRVLTNSLAATDAPVVHIGYARYRGDLLGLGVELHELRPRLSAPRSRVGSFGSSSASLHAKALVIDRRTVLVGSMNMDPRSARLNSEIGLVMRSPVLAGELATLFDEVIQRSAYRVERLADGTLHWASDDPAVPSVTGTEPEAGAGRQLLLMLLGPFAPEEML